MNELALLLRVLFTAILRAILPAAFDEAKKSLRDTAEDARPQPELRTRLQDRVRARWGRTGAAGALALCALMQAGCGTRAVYVESGEAVRLRQSVKRVKIWVPDANGNHVPSKMTLPEGWYCLPVSDIDKPPAVNETPAVEPSITGGFVAPDIPAVYAVPAPAPVSRFTNP